MKKDQNEQSNLIASVKMLNMGFINKYIIYPRIGGGGGGGNSELVNYQALLSNIFPLAPTPKFFFIKYRRDGLLHVSFIEL